MGIWDRLGSLLKSYINDGAERVFKEDRPWKNHGDDDLNAAYEELDDFLRGETAKQGFGSDSSSDTAQDQNRARKQGSRPVPHELKNDFAELGLSPGASEEECKEAYKKLLKMHHPDRHGADPDKMKKATEKASRINAAYDRLVKWHKADRQ